MEAKYRNNEDIKVIGSVIDVVLGAFGPYKKRGQEILLKHIKTDVLSNDSKVLYSMNDFLNGLYELQEVFGDEFLIQIGENVFEKAVFPPDINKIAQALELVNTAYYMNHKNAQGEELALGTIGEYKWIRESENSGHMVCDNPYPCNFDIGILRGITKKFEPGALVEHDDNINCQRPQGMQCKILIEW